MKSSIFLIGMMGAGKTTVGRVLARRMERPFVDSDHEIEARAGAGIPWIFEKEGEAGFRQREVDMIDELTQRTGIVLATGGGAVINPRNRRFMAERGIVIYLRADAEHIFQRVSRNRNRPLLQLPDPKRKIEELLAEREAYYSEIADIIIDTGRPRVQHLLRIILEQLRTKAVMRKSGQLDNALFASRQLQLDLSPVIPEDGGVSRTAFISEMTETVTLAHSAQSVQLAQRTTQLVQFEVSEMTMNSFTPNTGASAGANLQSGDADDGVSLDTFIAEPPVQVSVELGERSYPITIGADLLRHPQTGFARIKGARAVVITNDVVGPLYLDQVVAGLQEAGKQVSTVVLPDGEAFKTMDSLMLIFNHLLETRCDRKTTLVALGGGVIGDVVGYAAASFMRGVPFLQIPTTLLSQVDSSVGGKTGINHPLGKNMIGAFYQPVAVLADTMTLMTLPERELAAGLAEVIKYGAALDAPFFSWIEKHIDDLNQRDNAALTYAIQRCCEIKADVVRQDERESGLRAMLNFGHTFGHAIESGLGYGHWLHGEAVGCGMIMAADLSQRLGLIDLGTYDRMVNLVRRARLPVTGPDLGIQRWIDLMQVDKKNEGGQIRFIVMQGLGGSSMMTVERTVLEETLRALATLPVAQA